MSNGTHTPGPWYAVGHWVEHSDDDEADICNCDPASMGQEHFGRPPEEIEANARMCAAAPCLASALIVLIAEVEKLEEQTGSSFFVREMEQARAAINAAFGDF